MGVHAASETVVAGVFAILGALDLATEAAVEFVLAGIARTGFTEKGFVARNAYAFASLFDIEMREEWARWGGLAVEFYVDAYLVWAALAFVEPRPVLEPDSERTLGHWWSTRMRSVRYYIADLTVEKVYLPLAALCAVVSGTRAIGIAVENSVTWATITLVAGVELLLAFRFGLPMVVHAFDLAEARNEFDRIDGVSNRKRRWRGLFSAVVILPVLITAALTRAPRWIG